MTRAHNRAIAKVSSRIILLLFTFNLLVTILYTYTIYIPNQNRMVRFEKFQNPDNVSTTYPAINVPKTKTINSRGKSSVRTGSNRFGILCTIKLVWVQISDDKFRSGSE